MKLTTNFDLSEFIQSETATRLNIDNTPGMEELAALSNLTLYLLQPLRTLYGQKMVVNSGYRSPELNLIVGGVPTSSHLKGEAADIACANPAKLRDCLLRSGLDFDQCGVYKRFVHLSLKQSGKNRRQLFTGNY